MRPPKANAMLGRDPEMRFYYFGWSQRGQWTEVSGQVEIAVPDSVTINLNK